MAGERPDRRNEFEWMETRVGSSRQRSETHVGGRQSPTAELERLRAENRELRRALERHSRATERPAERPGRKGATPRLEDVERDHILRVLLDCHWRIKGPQAAAELLGLNPGTLYSRMKKLGISRDDV